MNPNRDIDTAKNNEENAAWLLEYITGREIALTSNEFSDFDFISIRIVGGVRHVSGIIEYRGRPDTKKTQYPTIVINCAKVVKINEWASLLGVDATFVVKWADTEPQWVSLRHTERFKINPNFTRREQARTNDRTEPVYEIPSGTIQGV